uniref:C2 n=1 Tax=Grapevine geminivirus A TaxID=1906317 RepID=A0A1L5YAK2_9GEMI|nr:TrAP/C2 [Grapevine geminivirus A]QNN81436.1 C2 [Grapevine geminivirus A]BDU96873.1 C2 [Grapevine geminivirus A]
MQFSSPCRSPSSNHNHLVPQKILHKQAKTDSPARRRRRINCQCNCIIYACRPCQGVGFTHRGVTYIAANPERSLLMDLEESSVCNDHTELGHIPSQREGVQDPVQSKSQHEEGSGATQMLDNIQGLDDLENIWAELFTE